MMRHAAYLSKIDVATIQTYLGQHAERNMTTQAAAQTFDLLTYIYSYFRSNGPFEHFHHYELSHYKKTQEATFFNINPFYQSIVFLSVTKCWKMIRHLSSKNNYLIVFIQQIHVHYTNTFRSMKYALSVAGPFQLSP